MTLAKVMLMHDNQEFRHRSQVYGGLITISQSNPALSNNGVHSATECCFEQQLPQTLPSHSLPLQWAPIRVM